MVCETFSKGDSPLHRTDPRVRVLVAVAMAVLLAVAHRFEVLVEGLAIAVGLAVVARLPLAAVLKRLGAINVFMVMLVIVLPLTMPGEVLFHVGRLAASREGLLRWLEIALKGNAIVLAVTALLSTVDLVTLGHALRHLRVPRKLVHLFFFTARYLDVLHHESHRLRNAMRVRCFQPRLGAHTYRSIGYLVGMLLVRSYHRSERVVAAMKCRGFRGRLHPLDHFAIGPSDLAFAAAAAMVLLALGWVECS